MTSPPPTLTPAPINPHLSGERDVICKANDWAEMIPPPPSPLISRKRKQSSDEKLDEKMFAHAEMEIKLILRLEFLSFQRLN
jgi:hypothetical protein